MNNSGTLISYSDPFILFSCQSRILIRLLQESADPLVLAVAAHDLGQYVKHYERGKKYVSSFLIIETLNVLD